MRRAPIVLASTVVGLAGVLAYRPDMSRNASSQLISASAAAGSGSSSGHASAAAAAPDTSSNATTTDTGGSQTTSSPHGGSSGGGSGLSSNATTATQPPPATPAPKPKPVPTTQTILGSTQQISQYGRQFGELQTKVTVSGGKITNVALAKINVFDGHSGQIEQYALPILMQQTIRAQSAQVNGVSGATYTSQAYEASIQAALDKANI